MIFRYHLGKRTIQDQFCNSTVVVQVLRRSAGKYVSVNMYGIVDYSFGKEVLDVEFMKALRF